MLNELKERISYEGIYNLFDEIQKQKDEQKKENN